MVMIKPAEIKKRGNSYQLEYYNPNGERRRLSVGKNLQNAKRRAYEYDNFLLYGKDPEFGYKMAQNDAERSNISLKEFFPVFMKRHGAQKAVKTQLSYQNSFNNILRCPQLEESPLAIISKSLVLDYMQLRMEKDGVKPATVNREAAFLKCMVSKAFEWDIFDTNQLKGN